MTIYEIKARELVDRFMSIKPDKMSDYSVIYEPTAKKCAIVAIQHELEWLNCLDELDDVSKMRLTELRCIWEEIEKL